MNRLDWKTFIKGIYQKPHFARRMIWCFLAVVVMGFCISWLNAIELGTDPCSVMNFGVSERLGMTFGNWQALLNVCLFMVVIWKDKSKIGFGTLFNMFIVGYSCDFMTWIRERFLGELSLDALWLRVIIMVVMLAIFVFAVAVYMSVDLGTAPYDALPFIIAGAQKKLSFKTVRILWDCAVTLIGYLCGGTVGIVTVIMAFTIGPIAALVGKHIKKYIE